MSQNKVNFHLLGRVLAEAKPYRLLFAGATILALAIAPVSTLRPFLIQKMVDEYVFTNDLKGLYYLAWIVIGTLLLESLLRYLFMLSTSLLGQNVIRDMRTKIFQKIISFKLAYFDRTPIGSATTRTINDIEKVKDVFTEGIIIIIADLLTLIAVLVMMFYTSWQLTLVVLTTFPLLIYATYLFKEKVQISYQQVRTEITKMNAFLQEQISGMRTVQIFNAEQDELKKFRTINRSYTKANLDAIFYYAVFFPAVEIISAAALGLLVWFGTRQALNEQITLGVLIAFPIYLSMLTRPMRILADKFNTLQMGLVAAQRVFDVLDLNQHIENNGTLPVTRFQGAVEFKSVFFAYTNEDWVLKEVSFDIQPGETLAIVGSTGSGKTTIISLLNRFYDIQKGEIRVDGQNIKDYKLSDYRDRVAIVLQDVFLFSGSVMENITLRNSNITSAQVIEAAKMIGAHEFIMKLPNGYDYQVMERGATLSMGQRQLISFVRALVFNPDILILDEATSSIDPESEAVIQYAIEQLIAKRTSIIIAHRLSTIRHANRILVLDKGEVKEIGSHEALLQNEDGHYAKLYEMQFLGLANKKAVSAEIL